MKHMIIVGLAEAYGIKRALSSNYARSLYADTLTVVAIWGGRVLD
jgi:hypothetical protein